MRWLVTFVVVALSPTMALGQYAFGDWARDQGYLSGDAMPQDVDAHHSSPPVDSLTGIGEFDWTTTPTTLLQLYRNALSSIEPGAFSGLMNLESLLLDYNQLASIEPGDFRNITDLEPLYAMDDLTDLWLVDTHNLDAIDLDVLLDNLETVEGADTEGVLHVTQADYDAFNASALTCMCPPIRNS